MIQFVNTFTPDEDSMDQRGGTSDKPGTVISCDEMEYKIFGPNSELGTPYRRRYQW